MNKSIDQIEFKRVIEDLDLSLIHFKAKWSGACQIASLIYEDLAKSYEDAARFYNIDIEEETGLDDEYGISGIPTILFFRCGQVVDCARGLTSKTELIEKIENALAG